MAYWWEATMATISLPLYAIVIIGEIIISNFLNRKLYNVFDTANNFLMTVLNMGIDFLMRGIFIFSMAWVAQFSFFHWQQHGWVYWILVIVFTDLIYWFVHWMSHMVRLFWAVHIVHHSSEQYNISVGFRSSVFEPLYRGFFFLPLAFFGFDAADVILAFAIQQLYGSMVHTQLIKRIPIWDTIFVSPSHHSVHHASNPRYLDKNMGMIFIIWDKLFGTFEPEDDHYESIKYGLTSNLNTYQPTVVLFKEWAQILRDVKSASGFKNKCMYIFGPPGWSHDGSRLTSVQMRKVELEKVNSPSDLL